MLNSLLQKIQELVGRRVSVFDPASLNDPVALQTAWTPAKGGGANFCTHRLVSVDHSRLEFKATAGAVVFYLIFLLAGLGMMYFFLSAAFRTGGALGLTFAALMPLLIGLIFALVGGVMLYFGTAPIVFDTRQGCFWKGRKSPENTFDKGSLKVYSRLDEIHALQIISEYCSGNKSSYYSYELNLVLKDGQRLNVVDHGNLARLREDAGKLAQFLGRPLWDGLGGGSIS
ncbi:MAG: hypothetical protein HGA96_04915 [Desulfobulbaceae bacterium]|nr:hypothetical protein [Desulfobulbaceae bacterium]